MIDYKNLKNKESKLKYRNHRIPKTRSRHHKMMNKVQKVKIMNKVNMKINNNLIVVPIWIKMMKMILMLKVMINRKKIIVDKI